MVDIAICDDDLTFTSFIEDLVLNLGKKYNQEINVDVFFSGRLMAEHIKKGRKYNLIYLDIEMTDQNGVDVAHDIRLFDKNVLIIYVTNHESFAKEAFEVSAYRFIVKPVEHNIFERYFVSALKELRVNPLYFEFQYNKVHYKILISDIMYFQSDKRVTYIITKEGISKCYEKMNNIERKLQDAGILFLRTHQSFLVNPDYVESYMFDSVRLVDGMMIGISNNRRKEVGKQYCRYKGEKVID